MEQKKGGSEGGVPKIDFHHPFEPYAIQKAFMSSLFDCLERGQIGIFESPTGTGKSLSLICGSLTWLRDTKCKELEGRLDVSDDDEDPEWMRIHARKQRLKDALSMRAEVEARLNAIRAKETKAGRRMEAGEPRAKRVKTTGGEATHLDDVTAYMLDDYESAGEDKTRFEPDSEGNLSSTTIGLMRKLGMHSGTAVADHSEGQDETKIFYCSRTHSQLAQFIHELRRVRMPSASAGLESKDHKDHKDLRADDVPTEAFKHVALGSRKTLCINEKVLKLGNATAINERCLELQQSGKSAECRCSFLPTSETESVVHDFRDYALAQVRDIEDLGALGRKLKICPYYASRAAVRPAEIVTLPYPLLLQKSARNALQLSLKGHIVIIDEAHNLMDTIASVNSASISLLQLQTAREQVTQYLERFRKRLKGKNRIYVAQLVRVLDSLMGYLTAVLRNEKKDEDKAEINQILGGKGVDQINLYRLMKYLQESKLARKVDGYTLHISEAPGTMPAESSIAHNVTEKLSALPVLIQVQSFLQTLTFPAKEGQFFYSKSTVTERSDCVLKYLLLDPTQQFREIVHEARSVVLAGGTMSPFDDYKDNLFHYVSRDRLVIHSYGHVVPPCNILAAPITNSPSGTGFDFTYGKRNDEPMIFRLGEVILQLVRRVPEGMVVFFPSYAYLGHLVQQWNRLRVANNNDNDQTVSFLDLFSRYKRIFMEPKAAEKLTTESTLGASKHVHLYKTIDDTLSAYSNQIATGNGALMFAVVGGSLSEGINFSDGLGRCIVVVGLPYPNSHSPEWQAKLEYNKTKASRLSPNDRQASSNDMLENACMRAVNQSVGRAIRHQKDYATIVLIDRRYGNAGVQKKLSGWIQSSLMIGRTSTEVMTEIDHFFMEKRS